MSNTMFKLFGAAAAASALMFCGGSAHALIITGPFPITDGSTGDPDPICLSNQNGSDESVLADCTAQGVAGLSGLTTLLYKQDVGGGESGLAGLKASYQFDPQLTAAGGTLTWLGGDSIDCSIDCFVLVKDGNANPDAYLYNLRGLWDGTEDLTFEGFWPDKDGDASRISHISFYGGYTSEDCPRGDPLCTPTRVPEPGTLALMGLALGGLGLSRRRRVAA